MTRHGRSTIDGVGVQHAIGALVGSAVGDALGAPFEFQEAGLYREANPAPRLSGRGELRGGGTYSWRPGEFTDDTQMALALAESLLDRGGFDPDDLWLRWRLWAAGARDVGVQTGSVLRAAEHDGAAQRLHERNGGRTAGNGSVMRNTPVGLWAARGDLDALITLATDQARLTHHDPHNGYAAAIHGAMIRAGVRGEDVLAAIDAALDRLPAEARERWAPLLGPAYVAEPDAKNGDVFTCLAQAVWAVRGAGSFEDAVVRAIDLGNDTDTVAAVAGGIAGARWGIQTIPSRWTTYVHGVVSRAGGDDVYDLAALVDLARRLVGRDPAPDTEADTPGGPTRVDDRVPLHVADLAGAGTAPADWAVVSLCRTPASFARRPVRRQVYLVDREGEQHNAAPVAVLDDVVATIDAFLAEEPDRPVLVHCHGGRSRSAFVLEAWAMRRYGWTADAAHAWLQERWPRAERSNATFVDVLDHGWA